MRFKRNAERSVTLEEAAKLRKIGFAFKFNSPETDTTFFSKQDMLKCRKLHMTKELYVKCKAVYEKNGVDALFAILRRRGYKQKQWCEIAEVFGEHL